MFTESTAPTNTPTSDSFESKLTFGQALVKRPQTLAETGLRQELLLSLLLKQLQRLQVATLADLSEKLALSGNLVQQLIDQAKHLQWLENRQASNLGQLRYSLSELGRREAIRALQDDGYVGAVPVSLEQYSKVCKAQSHRRIRITRSKMHQALANQHFKAEILDIMGAALNSNKATMLYGLPGVGKSYLCRHIIDVLDDSVFIPHAIEVHGQVIQVFDHQVHAPIQRDEMSHSLSAFTQPNDPRWIECKRPLIVTGGELTADMLEVGFDSVTRTSRAPIQLKANNGILLLDDLGRQRISPVELFNRWIIPLEEHKDFLSLTNGGHFEVPFEQVLLFSTNLNPESLVDDAFLRRLGYKVQLGPMDLHAYQTLWFETCHKLGIECEPQIFRILINDYHRRFNKPLIPCYPRDLLGIVSDTLSYHESERVLSNSLLQQAWQHYFVD